MNNLVKIGVYYDGNYLSNVSNYYFFQHARKSRINIEGLHAFIREQVGEVEETDPKLCKITDAHYFRGRMNASDAKELNKLYYERVFDDMLMRQGVVAHYLPLVVRKDGYREEKGIDVYLALEAFENALHNKYDVMVLIGSDGDYLPLVRKLSTQGIRVMVLSWEFNYIDENGYERGLTTSQDLLDAATYPVSMLDTLDDRGMRNDVLVNNMFKAFEIKPVPKIQVDDELKTSTIFSLHKEKGYGFISYPPDNIFFHFSHMAEGEDYNQLEEGDEIQFYLGVNERDGKVLAKQIHKATKE